MRLLGVGYYGMHPVPVNRSAGYRIFCVGESTTWGLGARNELLNNYPHQLETMLNRRFPGMRVQCFFDRTIGQNTSEILLKLPRYIEKYDPQMFIFMTGVNNWWNMDKSNALLFHQSGISRMTLKGLIFLDQFRVWKLLKNIVFHLGFYKERWNCVGDSEDHRKAQQTKDYDRLIFGEIARYDIEEMIKICKKNGVEAVLCNYPRGVPEYLRGVNEEIAKKNKVPFVDLFAFFKGLKDSDAYFWKDQWHPNDRGYALVAENIYNVILENKLIEKR